MMRKIGSLCRRNDGTSRKFFRLIACEIMFHEFSALLEELPSEVQVEPIFLPKGLHDVQTHERREALAQAIREAEDSAAFDAILLGYGLCSGGIVGLSSRKTPLVVPRAHDCIHLFMGDAVRYSNYFFTHPSTYFQTVGWQELGDDLTQFPPDSIQAQCGAGESLETFCEKYGPDNGPFLWKELGKMTRNYNRLAFLRTNPATDAPCEKRAIVKASDEGWELDVLDGNLTLLRDLLLGNWDSSRFLVLSPGFQISESFDERLIKNTILKSF